MFLRLAQSVSGNPLQFLVDIDKGFAALNALRRNVDAVLGEAEKLPLPQGTGERKMNRQLQNIIVAEVDDLEQRFGVPNLPLMFFTFRQSGVMAGVPGHQLPFDRLIKGIAEQLMDFPNGPGCDKAALGYAVGPSLGLDRFELLIKVIHHPGVDVIQLFTPNMRCPVSWLTVRTIRLCSTAHRSWP